MNVEIRHFHLFCGLGGGAHGFNQGAARIGRRRAVFRCLGGVDSDAAAVRDFGRLADVPGTVLDLFSREQFKAFHGAEPPADWREASPADMRNAAGGERPHIVFTSPPCKGFSGLLSQRKSETDKYQALNGLTVRGVWLALEAWADDPPEFFLLENVPRIQNRGLHLLEQIEELLKSYGYAVARTTHDCGELGGLAQRRKRFLLVARHREKVPPFLYEPICRPLRAVGEVVGRFPVPVGACSDPMHDLPRLHWRTWVRLAFVEAGKDWRSLNRLAVENGHLRDYLIVPEGYGYREVLGVTGWDESGATVSGQSRPANGRYSVADPRAADLGEYGQYGVKRWDETGNAVSAQSLPGGGRYSEADPRMTENPRRHYNLYRVARWDGVTHTVIGATRPGSGALGVADPRPGNVRHNNVCRVADWHAESPSVTGGAGPSSGGMAVADPRPKIRNALGYQTAGHYGVVPWSEPAGVVAGVAKHDTGRFSVADPRLPEPSERLQCVIVAEDGTWHRPFTTLELAALQGLVDPESPLHLDGASHSGWRERIGNAVPPPAAAAIASVMGRTLLQAWGEESYSLEMWPVWVRKLAVAASVETPR